MASVRPDPPALPAGIHRIPLPLAGNPLQAINAYLLAGDDGYVLVDCGWDTSDVLAALQAGLRGLGVGLDDVRTLVVTHFHTDHYGLAGTLLRLGRLRLLMHRIDWLYVRTRLADLGRERDDIAAWLARNGLAGEAFTDDERRALDEIARYTIVAPDRELEDADRVELRPHAFEVIWTPGHTPGHICLYDGARRVLVAGDHVLDPITPNVGLWRREWGNPLGDYLGALRKVGRYDADLVLPAHGQPFTGLRRRVDELLAHHAEREAAILAALADRQRTAAEVAGLLPWTSRKRRFAELSGTAQRFAVAETLAHLEELYQGGRVQRLERGDRIFYYS